MPRIYFAKNVKFVDFENAFEELLKVKDFNKLTLIEISKSDPRSPTSGDLEVGLQMPENQPMSDFGGILKSDFNIQEFRPEYVKIKTSGNGGWLIYSDANLPTWEAYIDGQKTEIHTANYLFKAVFVPKGEHEIIFKYPGLWGQFKYAIRNVF